MVNNEFVKDISKSMDVSGLNQEFAPGSVGRRYEPDCGIKKHNERIHRESKLADTNSSLPFSFSKPKKYKKARLIRCCNCGNVTSADVNTVGIICTNCKQYSNVEEYKYE